MLKKCNLKFGKQIFSKSFAVLGCLKFQDECFFVDAVSGSYVLYNRGDDRITLTTCHPKYSARQRLVVSGLLY